MEDDLKDSTSPPLRLHDHPTIAEKSPGRSINLGGRYKKRAEFTDKELIFAISRAIIARREELGWTQQLLAVEAGVASPSVNRLETGSVKDMDLTTMLRVVKALQLEIKLSPKI